MYKKLAVVGVCAVFAAQTGVAFAAGHGKKEVRSPSHRTASSTMMGLRERGEREEGRGTASTTRMMTTTTRMHVEGRAERMERTEATTTHEQRNASSTARTAALTSARETYTTALKSARTTFQAAMKAATTKTEKKAARSTYQAAVKAAQQAFSAAKRAARGTNAPAHSS